MEFAVLRKEVARAQRGSLALRMLHLVALRGCPRRGAESAEREFRIEN